MNSNETTLHTLAIAFATALLLAASPALAGATDIPGVVVVEDENDVEDAIAFSSPAKASDLGQQLNVFGCDLQDGDAECVAAAIDGVEGALVYTVFEMHQPNALEHKGPRAYVQQKHLMLTILVFEDTEDMDLIGEVEGLATGCKGVTTIKDVDGNDSQDRASWKINCPASTLRTMARSIEGDEVSGNGELARAAALAVINTSVVDGRVRLKGHDNDGPSLLDPRLEDL